jgi:hypothetical protein
MKWIKTSELIPDENKKVILRFPWHNNTRVLDYGILKPKEPEDNQRWFATDNYGSIPERETGLEWLDETPEEWISLEADLPKTKGYYLAWDINFGSEQPMDVLFYQPYNQSWYYKADTFHPTHWRPLPSAPGKGEISESQDELWDEVGNLLKRTWTIGVLKERLKQQFHITRSAPGIKDEKENDYWKKRCEAAEDLIAVMNVPKNEADGHNDSFMLFGQRNETLAKIKTSNHP